MYIESLIYLLHLQCTVKIFTAQILEPDCKKLSLKPRPSVSNWDPDTLIEDPVDLL